MKKVVFLCRAYNDFDCKLPLILEFHNDVKYHVSIVNIPTNNGLNNIKDHDLFYLIEEKKIDFKTVFEFSENFITRFLYNFYLLTFNKLFKKIPFKIQFLLNKAIFILLKNKSAADYKLFKNFSKQLENSIMIIDEIIFEDNRSFILDKIKKIYLLEKKFDIFSIFTGQNTHIIPSDILMKSINKEVYKYGFNFFVPGPYDLEVFKIRFPKQEILIVGNTRFDKPWVEFLNSNSNELKNSIINKSKNKNKIVFMLSKLEYGVRFDDLIDTINLCAEDSNNIVIVKPHTRGMRLEELGNKLSNKIINGYSFSSNDLFNWSDFSLFTGSSIIFHAFALNKKIVYLKHCQKGMTIFDSFDKKLASFSINDVEKIMNSKQNIIEDQVINKFLNENIYNNSEEGLVCNNIKKQIEKIVK